jgi:hypothetical protein
MKIKAAATTAMLSLAITAGAQITKNQKYDWGWSYKLEMPETGLKCEFPEKPSVTTLAYGYMTAASYKDELYVAAKLENPNPYDIACRTEEFTAELKRIHNLPITEVVWDEIRTENGNLTISGDADGKWAQFHIDAIASEDVLTVFIYANHDLLTVPGHFFANSYSVYDIPEGDLSYMNEAKTIMKAKVLEYDNGRSLVRLENSPITLEWPAIPTLEVNRHEAAYNLDKNGRHYSTRIIEAGPQVSYAFFNTFINKEHQKLSSNSTVELTSDETDIAFELGTDKEAFFRKMIYNTPSGIKHCFYVGAENKIIVQELDTDKISTADARFINTFEQSVRNQYDTRTFVSK